MVGGKLNRSCDTYSLKGRLRSIMHGEDRHFLISSRGFEAHRIAYLAVHQGLRQGRNRADSPLGRVGFTRPNDLKSFLFAMLISNVN